MKREALNSSIELMYSALGAVQEERPNSIKSSKAFFFSI